MRPSLLTTFAAFYGAARAARRHRALRRAIASVLRYADAGSTPLVVLIASGSGVAEELFFRGALWSGPRPLRRAEGLLAARPSPVTVSDEGLEERDGIEAKTVILRQLAGGLEVIRGHDPARIAPSAGSAR